MYEAVSKFTQFFARHSILQLKRKKKNGKVRVLKLFVQACNKQNMHFVFRLMLCFSSRQCLVQNVQIVGKKKKKNTILFYRHFRHRDI